MGEGIRRNVVFMSLQNFKEAESEIITHWQMQLSWAKGGDGKSETFTLRIIFEDT